MLLYGRVAMTSSQHFDCSSLSSIHQYTNSRNFTPCRLLSQIMREDAVELTLELEDVKEAHKSHKPFPKSKVF